MASLRTALHLLKSNRLGFCDAAFEKMNKKGWLHWLSDKTFLRIAYYLKFGRRLNLKNPKSFNEKLQWLKLYDRRPEYVTMVDKYAVKEYVARIIGDEYIIPTFGVWNRPEDIEWDKLPERFVLKTTHGGGSNGVVICKDKESFDKGAAVRILKNNMRASDWRIGMEWPYKNVPHRIIAEQYIDPAPVIKDLVGYKFFCFDGEVMGLFVTTENRKEKADVEFEFFDADYNRLSFKQGLENAQPNPSKPKDFELMKMIAAQLSKGHLHVRVDLYNVGDKVMFGELTKFHLEGVAPFRPEERDKVFGEKYQEVARWFSRNNNTRFV